MTPSARWIACVFAAAFAWFGGWAVYLNPHHLPLSQDEVAYVFQARIFASGRVAVAPALVPEGFDAESICTHRGRRFAGYPPGLPVVLAAFAPVAPVWLAGPFVLALTVAVLFGTAWRLGGPHAAWLATGCALLSRSFVFAAPLYVSEPLAMLCTVVLARAVLTGAPGLSLSGALMWIRPVTGAAVLGCALLALDNRRRVWLALTSTLWFAGSAVLETAIAGERTTELYRFWGQTFVEHGWTPALALSGTLARVLGSLVDTVPQAAPVLAVWAAARRRELWLLPATYLALVLVHVARHSSGHAFLGARYLVPAAPLLILAAAILLTDRARRPALWHAAVLAIGLVQLALFDAPLRKRAMEIRAAVDPGLAVPRTPGRTLVLCRTVHFERERAGHRADNYYMAFHWNGLEEAGDLLFAREAAADRLRAVYKPDRVITVGWSATPDGPRCRLVP